MQMILPFIMPNAFLIRFAKENKKTITPRNDQTNKCDGIPAMKRQRCGNPIFLS
jgi:hypothetical protein